MRMTCLAVASAVLLSACGGGEDEEGGSCGIPGLVAEPRPSFGDPNGCGIADPVAVSRVAGVGLSQPALMTCRTAATLDSWVRLAAKPAFEDRGGLRSLDVAAHYSCRTRNSRPGARLSEHAKGRAIDISGFVLNDGRRVTVLEGWNNRSDGGVLRSLHRAACRVFGTVLGPGSDGYHKDHIHLDTAPYRSGAFCRPRL